MCHTCVIEVPGILDIPNILSMLNSLSMHQTTLNLRKYYIINRTSNNMHEVVRLDSVVAVAHAEYILLLPRFAVHLISAASSEHT